MKGILGVRRAGLWKRGLLISCGALVLGGTGSVAAVVVAAPAESSVAAPAAPASPLVACTTATCTFSLSVNPGLTAGHPFACPAMQNATASISIDNRLVSGAANDVMTLTASGLPPRTGFDLFLVEHSPFDAGFAGFGFGWYQSDVDSDTSGNASVEVRGIFDKETFIVNPGSTTPVHTFNVGFWFNSPTQEANKCPSAAPAATPFNGGQNAGLLAMITTGGPLNKVRK